MAVEQPREIAGFRYMGFTGSATSAGGYRRGCNARGETPKHIRGTPGQGRAHHVRTYTVTTRRLSDGAELSFTVGPAYWSRKRWATERAAAHLQLVRKLGGRC